MKSEDWMRSMRAIEATSAPTDLDARKRSGDIEDDRATLPIAVGWEERICTYLEVVKEKGGQVEGRSKKKT